MLEDEQTFVFYAQKYVDHHLKKKKAKQTITFVWGSKTLDLGPNEYGLAIHKGDNQMIFTFTRDELIEGYGTSEWKERLVSRSDEIFDIIGYDNANDSSCR